MQTLRIDQIRAGGGTQVRQDLNRFGINDYADLLLEAAAFPPVAMNGAVGAIGRSLVARRSVLGL